ncbi:MAG: N-alpha-acetyltransferase 35 NatC auxiliary subunit [Chaenotheca gracillima]|nr:MAG: N-alpha-acetyltransferase 35 NatC auxiliary subunit [Chaenotheca gracillima]
MQHAAELCTLLVDEVYGQLTSRVFSTLLRVGRMPLVALVQKTDLQPRQLRHALAVLIQQHLVLHYTAPHTEATFYEADWKAAYGLIRSGKVRRLLDETVSSASGDVVSNLLLLGHTRVGDLLKSYSAASSKEIGKVSNPKATVNGGSNGHKLPNGSSLSEDSANTEAISRSTGDLQLNLRTLLDTGFVSGVRMEHFRPPADNHAEAERIVRERQFPDGPKGNKGQAVLAEEIRKKMREWRDDEFRPATTNGIIKNSKRPAEDSLPSNRAKKLKYDPSALLPEVVDENGDEEDQKAIVDENLVVRVNEGKCQVAWRNQRLVELAERRVGTVTSVVYKNFLEKLTEPLRRCQDELATPPADDDEPEEDLSVSTFELFKHMDPEIDLASSIRIASQDEEDHKPKSRMSNGRRRRRVNDDDVTVVGDVSPDESEEDEEEESVNIPEVDQDSNEEEADGDYVATMTARNSRMRHIETHLELLAEDSHHFVQPSMFNKDRWTVDFRALVTHLKNLALDDIIRSRWDQTAMRVERILREKGKLDERQLANVALAPAKHIRVLLAEMHEAGYLELQEVPRDNTRAPSRTFYLWFFDLERCTKIVLEDLYKCLARLVQRGRSEREKIKDLLKKAERTDVVGMEDKYLTQQEREELKRSRDIEERLLLQMERVDDLIAVLRDF